MTDGSFVIHDPSPPSTGSHVDDHDDILDDLPSPSDTEVESDDGTSDAEREWRESLQQL
ncbi:MAG: hypothetical protein M1820_010884, partial [Bogoriella megaspora]